MVRDASWLDPAGRVLIALYFVITGLCNLTRERIDEHIERMAVFHTPFPAAAFWIGIALQFTGSALLCTDRHAEIGVYCLIAFTLAATAIFHRFWSMRDPQRRNMSRLMLLSNTGILGGLLLLLASVR